MNKKTSLPPREELDHAFHYLQDQITRITVDEEEEMLKQEKENQLD